MSSLYEIDVRTCLAPYQSYFDNRVEEHCPSNLCLEIYTKRSLLQNTLFWTELESKEESP